MFYTIYKTTNLANGKIYIGAHRTEKLDDGYLGSGDSIRRAIKKHGRQAFTKEILFVFDNPGDMLAKEAELVNEIFVGRRDTYNLAVGGCHGKNYYESIARIDPEMKTAWAKSAYSKRVMTKDQLSEWGRRGALAGISRRPREFYEKLAALGREKQGLEMRPPSWKGKTHSEASRSKISSTLKGRCRGSGNSQYGTRWACHPELGSKKVPGDQPLGEGWMYGRTFPSKRAKP